MTVSKSKLEALYRMTQAIGAVRHLDTVLDILTRELAEVLDVRAVSVKLLSADGRSLRYAVASGLPEALLNGEPLLLERSPLNRRVIDGEPFVSGEVSERELFQFGDHLAAARFKSVLFVPLTVAGRSVGVLGAYRHRRNRFGREEVELARLTADLVAITLDSARAWEDLERSSEEQARFLRRVGHNLRAPLSAVISMLEVVRDDPEGSLSSTQREYLRRVERRSRTMLELINDLLGLVINQELRQAPRVDRVSPSFLAERLYRTFEESARDRDLELVVTAAESLSPLRGDAGSLEQIFENLLSNALKYSKPGGKVELTFSECELGLAAITVRDEGIGIPEDEQVGLFTEFFRASNAKRAEEHGTGLGLAVVKDAVTAHGGTIDFTSREGQGTTFVLRLPCWSEGEEP